MCPTDTPYLSASTLYGCAEAQIFRISESLSFVTRELCACCCAVAHLQLLGVYPFVLTLRSRLIPTGGSPMSAKKFSNRSHRLQTFIPRSAYTPLSFVGAVGEHRLIMLAHAVYALVLCACPCLVFAVMARSIRRHPHDSDPIRRSSAPRTERITPQEHRHIHQLSET